VKWADEIVVVDACSGDMTPDICRQYTDRVFSEKWEGFARQKNKAISLTTCDWVFVLDADERVTDGLKNEILKIIRASNALDGYYVPRRNYFKDRWIKHSGWWPDYTLRLFRRTKGRFEIREVHESIKVDGETGYLKNPIEHYTYSDVNDYFKRMQTYSTLSARELFKNGRKAYFFDIIIRPVATFVRMYFLQRGIFDGIYGIILSCLYSLYTYKKYSKLRKMQKEAKF
jgi:glycosyltransferase involved in cell wall biosynthesis